MATFISPMSNPATISESTIGNPIRALADQAIFSCRRSTTHSRQQHPVIDQCIEKLPMKATPSITINNPQDLALGNSAGYELGNVVGSMEANGKKQTMQSVYLAVFVHSNQQWLIKAETISVGNAYAAGIPRISKREKLCKLDPAMC